MEKGMVGRGAGLLAALLLLVGTLVVLPSTSASAADPPARAIPEPIHVSITDAGFVPAVITSVAGQSVVFRNDTASSRSVAATDGLFDSGPIPVDGAFTVSVPEARQVALTSAGAPVLTATLSVGQLEVQGPADDPVASHVPRLDAPPEDPATFAPDPVWGVVASRTTILVGFKASATVGDANRLLAAIDGTITGTLADVGVFRVTIPDRADGSFDDLEAALATLRADPAVAFAARDTLGQDAAINPTPPKLAAAGFKYEPYPFGVTSAGIGAYGMEQARFPQAWNFLDAAKRKLNPVDVVVLDNGVETTHPEFASGPNQRSHLRVVSTCLDTPSCLGNVAGGHGTPVAGLVGGSNTGGDPLARLVAVRAQGVATAAGPGSTAYNVAQQFLFLADEAHPGGLVPNLKAINYSNADYVFARVKESDPRYRTLWEKHFFTEHCGPGATDDLTGTDPCTPANEDGFLVEAANLGTMTRVVAEHVSTKGVVIVAAGGNYGDDSGQQGSFCLPFMTDPPVCDFAKLRSEYVSRFSWASRHWTSSTPNNIVMVGAVTAFGQRAPYSTIANDVSGGSTSVVSAGPGGEYVSFSGTSAATPIVSGLVGLLANYAPDLSPGQLRSLVIDHAHDIQTPNDDADRLIDAYASITAIPGAMIDALDINDPSADGNRRVIRPKARSGQAETSDDRLGDVVDTEQLHTEGDGAVDMRDWRRFRDAWLQGCTHDSTTLDCPAVAAISLDGDPAGPKHDLNLDGCVGPFVNCPGEDLYPRFDPAGTGTLDANDEALVGITPQGDPSTTNLRVPNIGPYRVLWGQAHAGKQADTEGWTKDDLNDLRYSGDVEVHADDLIGRGAAEVTVAVSYSNNGGASWTPAPTRTFTPTSRDGVTVVSVKVGKTNTSGAKVRARVSATIGGKAVKSLLATGTVKIGGDIRLDPCVATAILTPSSKVLATKSKGKLKLKVDACGRAPVPGNGIQAPTVGEDDPEGSPEGISVDFDAQGTGDDPADPTITREDTETDDEGVATADVDAGEESGDAQFDATATFEDGATVAATTDAKVLAGVKLVYRWEQKITDFDRNWDDISGAEEEPVKVHDVPAPGSVPIVHTREGTIDLGTAVPTLDEQVGEDAYAMTRSDDQGHSGTVSHSILPTSRTRDDVQIEGMSASQSDRAVTIRGLRHVSDLSYPYDCGKVDCTSFNTAAAFFDGYLAIGPRRDVGLYGQGGQLIGFRGGDGTAIEFAPDVDADLTFLKNGDGSWRTYSYCGSGAFTFPTFAVRPQTGGGHYETRFVATLVDTDGTPVLDLPDCSNPAPPQAAFSSDPAPGRVGVPTQFTDETVAPAGVAAYAWDFGDGESSSAQSREHRYGTPGGYSVKLTVTDGKGRTNTVTRHVDVLPDPPTAELDDLTVGFGDHAVLHGRIFTPSELGQGSLRVDLTSPAPDFPKQFQRNLPAGPIDIDLGSLEIGTYPVTMTVTDVDGQVTTAAATIVVQSGDPPEPPDQEPVEEPAGGECDAGVTVEPEVDELLQGLDGMREYVHRLEVFPTPTLIEAAQRHAEDMAAHPDVVHTGSDDSTPRDRATDAGYPEVAEVDELVLRGPEAALDALVTWHIDREAERTLLDVRWTGMGAARVHVGNSWVWVLVLGEFIDCPEPDGGAPVAPETARVAPATAAPAPAPEATRAPVTSPSTPTRSLQATSVDRGDDARPVPGIRNLELADVRASRAVPGGPSPPTALPLPAAVVPGFVTDRVTATTADDVQIRNRTFRAGALVDASFDPGDGRPERHLDAGATVKVRWPAAGNPAPSIRDADDDDAIAATLDLAVTGPLVTPGVAYTGAPDGAQGAPVVVSAKVTSSPGGVALPGWPVQFTLGTATVTAATGDDGVATAELVVPAAQPLGDQTLEVRALAVGGSPSAVVDAPFNVRGNEPPEPDAGGPYELLVNQPLVLDGTGSTDAEDGLPTLRWDLGADGDAPERTGVHPPAVTFADAGTELCGGPCEAGVAYPLDLEATDSKGAVVVDHTTVTYSQDFVLTINPSSSLLNPGGSVSYEIGVLTSSGFDEPVELAVSGLPDGVTASFGLDRLTPNAHTFLTLRAGPTITAGATPFVVTGTSGALTRTTGASVDLEFGLVPVCSGSLEGVVTDRETGQPIPGTQVNFGAPNGSTEAVTDVAGHFRIDDLPLDQGNAPRTWTFFFVHFGHDDVGFSKVVACNQVTDASASLLPNHLATMVGTITEGETDPTDHGVNSPVTSTGVPISGAQLFFTHPRLGQPVATTGADGTYAFDPLRVNVGNAPLSSAMSIVAPGYWRSSAPFTLVADQETVIDRSLVKACTATARVRVLDDVTKEPVSGILVHVRSQDTPLGMPGDVSGASDAQGWADISGIVLGYNNADRSAPITADGDPFRGISGGGGSQLVLNGCGSHDVGYAFVHRPVENFGDLQVTVLDDATGDPIEGAGVDVPGAGGKATPADGVVRFDHVSVGLDSNSRSYNANVHKDGYYDDGGNTTVVKDQLASIVVRLKKPQIETIKGRVTDVVTGEPLAGFEVNLGSVSAITDADGRYEASRDFLGREFPADTDFLGGVGVSTQRGYWGVERNVEFTFRQGGTGVADVKLLRECATATIRGHVFNAATHEPLEDASVSGPNSFAKTDADGAFILRGERLYQNRPNSSFVTASKPGFFSATKPVTIFCGAQVVVDFGSESGVGSITGTVTRVSDGTPVSGAFVGSEFGGSATTAADGTYTLANAPLGPGGADRDWKVTVTPPAGSGLGGGQKTATVTAEAPTVVDFQLGAPVLPPPPDVVDDEYSLPGRKLSTVDVDHGVLVNDTGADLVAITYTQPDHGFVNMGLDGRFDFSTNDSFLGDTTFTYTAVDSSEQRSTATVTIHVTGPPVPKAVDDAYTTANTSFILITDFEEGLLANDIGVVGVSGNTDPPHGTVFMDSDGTFEYDPDFGFVGLDTFEYTIRDDFQRTSTATVRITVTGQGTPAAPVATNDSGSTPYQTALDVGAPGVLGNDTGTGISVTGSTQPAHGTASVDADGSYTYTPAAGFSGQDSFTYTITDSLQRTATATVTVTVDEPPPEERLAIGDRAFRDLDGNGIQDPGEPGLAGVAVQLADGQGGVVASTVTDANGHYVFDDLAAGDYRVHFGAPAGMAFAPAGQGADAEADSDPDTSGATAIVHLTPGSDPHLQPVAQGDGTTVAAKIDRSIDAGFVPLPAGLFVTKTVRVAGSSDPFAAVAQGPLGTAFTWHVEVANTGDVGLNAVTVTDPTFAGCDRTFESLAAGGTESYDCDGTATPAADTVNQVHVAGNLPGDVPETLSADGSAAIELTYSIGDRVWDDVDHDGLQDQGESGIGGVGVALVTGSGAGTEVATTTTAADGSYRFDGVRPGSYRVRFSLPAGYRWTLAGAGSDPTVDSDAAAAGPTAATATSGEVSIADGQPNASGANPLALTEPRIDAGAWRPGSISGIAFADADHDGTRDSGEPGVPGVPVELVDAEGTTVATTTTDRTGRYEFHDLVPGTYRVRYTIIDGFDLPVVVAPRGRADLLKGVSDPVVVAAGAAVAGIDLGLWPKVAPPTSTTTTSTTTTTTPGSSTTSTSGSGSTTTATAGTSTTAGSAVASGGQDVSSGTLSRTGQDLGVLVAGGLVTLISGALVLVLRRRSARTRTT